MSIIRSYAVGNGDMFHIFHNTDNFTIIDCCLNEDREKSILDIVEQRSDKKGIVRFISTHPDDDHIRGLDALDDRIKITNFYCVKNECTKDDETDSFKRYCELRDDEKKAFYIYKGCSRRWMNEESEERGPAGIHVLWPDTDNEEFIDAVEKAKDGGSPNNLSAVIQYKAGGFNFLWMGDLETDFMEKIEDSLNLPKVHVLFAPHHGRDSGKVPESLLKKMNPDIIVVGEAPSKHLNYYQGYNTITQNSTGDICFHTKDGQLDIFTEKAYEVDYLQDMGGSWDNWYYIGSLVSK